MKKSRKWFNQKIRWPIVKKKFILLNKISDFFERWAMKYECLPDGPALDYKKPTKAEREERNNKIGIGFTILFVALCVAVVICYFAKYYFTVRGSSITFGEWNGSAGSFWGAVLGAIIAGIATVVTTVFVIQRSYKIDYHRERLEVLPVLDMKVICKENLNPRNSTKGVLRDKVSNETVREVLFDGSVEQQYASYVFLIKNVGRGIAYKVQASGFCYADYNEEEYQGLIPQNESIILVSRNKGIAEASILFYDLYGNKYRQTYTIDEKNIIADPPELLRKTERIRYTQ